MNHTLVQNSVACGPPTSNMNSRIFVSEVLKPKEEEETVDFAKKVKEYADEAITGMTEDDWEEFERLCKEYLNERPIRTEGDVSAFQKYMKGILKRLGFKGDMDEFIENFYTDIGKGGKVFDGSATASLDNTVKKIITETDGKKYLLITTSSGQAFKIRISDGVELQNDEESLIEM